MCGGCSRPSSYQGRVVQPPAPPIYTRGRAPYWPEFLRVFSTTDNRCSARAAVRAAVVSGIYFLCMFAFYILRTYNCPPYWPEFLRVFSTTQAPSRVHRFADNSLCPGSTPAEAPGVSEKIRSCTVNSLLYGAIPTISSSSIPVRLLCARRCRVHIYAT